VAERDGFEPSRPFISHMLPRFHAHFSFSGEKLSQPKRGSPKVIDVKVARDFVRILSKCVPNLAASRDDVGSYQPSLANLWIDARAPSRFFFAESRNGVRSSLGRGGSGSRWGGVRAVRNPSGLRFCDGPRKHHSELHI
jgi:hypothetical protein